MATTKTATVHKHSSRSIEADSIERYTACGAAATIAKYACSSDPSKITCRKCKFRMRDDITPLLAAVEDFREKTYWLCAACRESMGADVVRQPKERVNRCERCG